MRQMTMGRTPRERVSSLSRTMEAREKDGRQTRRTRQTPKNARNAAQKREIKGGEESKVSRAWREIKATLGLILGYRHGKAPLCRLQPSSMLPARRSPQRDGPEYIRIWRFYFFLLLLLIFSFLFSFFFIARENPNGRVGLTA